MSIDIPRVQPVVTPPGIADEDELRVRRTAREPRIPAELPAPGKERRVRPERRQGRGTRPDGFELRSGNERRARVNIDA